MNGDLNIAPGELRASARAARGVCGELERPLKTALTDLGDAAAALRAWPLGSALGVAAEGWGSALEALSRRVGDQARGLEMVAAGGEGTEQGVRDCFRGW